MTADVDVVCLSDVEAIPLDRECRSTLVTVATCHRPGTAIGTSQARDFCIAAQDVPLQVIDVE